MGRALTLVAPPARIVSLVPSVTETLFDLGLADRIVGVTRFCVRPDAGVRGKTRVGGTKRLDLARIRALAPDLVIANKEENRREEVASLAADLPVYVQYPRTLAETAAEILRLGALTGTVERAGPLAGAVETARREVAARARAVRPIRTAYLIWRNPYWVAGGDTYIDDMLATCGAANVFAGRAERYFPVRADQIAAAVPEVILLPDEPFPFAMRHSEELRAHPEIAAVGPRILLADGRLLSWHGSCAAEGVRYLWDLLRG